MKTLKRESFQNTFLSPNQFVLLFQRMERNHNNYSRLDTSAVARRESFQGEHAPWQRTLWRCANPLLKDILALNLKNVSNFCAGNSKFGDFRSLADGNSKIKCVSPYWAFLQWYLSTPGLGLSVPAISMEFSPSKCNSKKDVQSHNARLRARIVIITDELEEMNHHPLVTVFIFALVIGGQLGDSESTGIDRYHWEICKRR